MYDDIINHPHHVSSKRPQMHMEERAAQFSPFAALTGYNDAIRETGRLTDDKTELDEDTQEEINRKLQFLAQHIGEKKKVRITYFEPDSKKTGGKYIKIACVVRKIDGYGKQIILSDGKRIPIDDLFDIDIE